MVGKTKRFRRLKLAVVASSAAVATVASTLAGVPSANAQNPPGEGHYVCGKQRLCLHYLNNATGHRKWHDYYYCKTHQEDLTLEVTWVVNNETSSAHPKIWNMDGQVWSVPKGFHGQPPKKWRMAVWKTKVC